MAATAQRLADWAGGLEPTDADLALAGRALIDTVAVTVAARREPIAAVVAGEHRASQWAALAHILDFDDLHMESTTHISAVCVPTVLSVGGDARAYLAGAGVMARIGALLGWPHYAMGWHATTTAGAPAAAAAAAVALGLNRTRIATAIALAVPAAGGVQRSFGTLAKPLQVGFAAEAGVRAARLAAKGAVANPAALDQWLELMGVDGSAIALEGPAIPGGLAMKLFPCCYAMQRPIAVVRDMELPAVAPTSVRSITVRTPQASVHPLVHPVPTTGLESKFSLPYALAVVLLDRDPGFGSFTDEAVGRPEAQELMSKVVLETTSGGSWLLDGELEVTLDLVDRSTVVRTLTMPPGSPARPASADDLRGKVERCCPDLVDDVMGLSWPGAADLLEGQVTH